MTTKTIDQLAELILTSFPVEPLPRVFWVDGAEQPCGDIPEELMRRLAHRRRVDITMHDWTMIGPACIAKPYLHPDAFRYYLPSLLTGVREDLGYLDWALECLPPAGRKRRTDRAEWTDFWDGLSVGQREAIRSYLKHVRRMLGDSIDPSNQQFFDELEVIWGGL